MTLIDVLRDRRTAGELLRQRLRGSPVWARLARGAFWALVGTVVSRGFTFISFVIAARLLGLVEFGKLGVIQSTITMLSTMAGFSLGLMSTKYVAEFYQKDPARAGRIISLSSVMSWVTGGVMTLVLVVIARELAAWTLGAPQLTHQLRIGALLLVLGSVTGAQVGTLYGFEAFRVIAKVNFTTGIATFVGVVSGTWLYGLDGALWGIVGSQVVTFISSSIALQKIANRHGIRRTFRGCLREIKLIWSFGVPAMMGGVMVGPVIWATNAFVVNQPNGFAEMGIFNAANQLRQLILFFPTTLASVALPMLSNLQGLDSMRNYRKLFWANLGLSAGSAGVIAIPIAFLAPWVMGRFGAPFRVGSTVLILLCGVSVITATLNSVGDSIVSEGKMWAGFMLNLIWATVLLSMGFLLRRHGAMGLAIATLAAYATHTLTSAYYVRIRLSRWASRATSYQPNS